MCLPVRDRRLTQEILIGAALGATSQCSHHKATTRCRVNELPIPRRTRLLLCAFHRVCLTLNHAFAVWGERSQRVFRQQPATACRCKPKRGEDECGLRCKAETSENCVPCCYLPTYLKARSKSFALVDT